MSNYGKCSRGTVDESLCLLHYAKEGRTQGYMYMHAQNAAQKIVRSKVRVIAVKFALHSGNVNFHRLRHFDVFQTS